MTKISHVTAEALRQAFAGVAPDVAWRQALKSIYPPQMLASQIKHSCPKWAFSSLCHQGHVEGIQPGGCPAAAGKRSAAFTLNALERIRRDPSLVHDKRELKRRVFGEVGTPGYRTPNGEVEVLVSLLKSGDIKLREASDRVQTSPAGIAGVHR
jgi:hypothetical protein